MKREAWNVERHAPRAFSLVELLVVIAILSILFALLMPSLSRARESAKSAVCASNMKQLHTMLFMYSQENRGRIPKTYEYLPGKTNYWAEVLTEGSYLLKDAVLQMKTRKGPLFCIASRVALSGTVFDWRNGHYGLSVSIAGCSDGVLVNNPNYSLNRVNSPTEKILLLDSGSFSIWHYDARTPRYAVYYVPGAPANANGTVVWPDWNVKDAILGRHPGKRINVAWVDGHVTSVPVAAVTNANLWEANY